MVPWHGVVETTPYLAKAKRVGMTEAEMKAAVDLVATNPTIGDLIQGTGGCRKVRLAREGGGKSGGYRLITYFFAENAPVFLLTVFAKGQKASLSDAEKAGLFQAAKSLQNALHQASDFKGTRA